MKISISIPDKRIRELMATGSSRYWGAKFRFLGKGLAFTITEHNDGPLKVHKVSAARVRDGLRKMAASAHDEGGHHFPAVMGLTADDCYTGDAVVQYAVFGELKYG